MVLVNSYDENEVADKIEVKPALINPYDEKEVADKILEDWDDVCNSLNIPHFVFMGTCLGFYRDAGYIESDSDLDVGVLCSLERLKDLVEALAEKNISGRGRLICNINIGREHVLLDVWHVFGPLHMKFLTKFDTITYNERTYNTPFPIEDYLKFAYVDWKTPVAYDARGEDGSWLGKTQQSACDYTDGGPVLL